MLKLIKSQVGRSLNIYEAPKNETIPTLCSKLNLRSNEPFSVKSLATCSKDIYIFLGRQRNRIDGTHLICTKFNT